MVHAIPSDAPSTVIVSAAAEPVAPGKFSPTRESLAQCRIPAWKPVNQEAIHGTRPRKVMGEGPQMAATEASSGSSINEDKVKPFTAGDVRFTTKGVTLYATVMGAPKAAVTIKSLGTSAKLLDGAIGRIALLGSDEKLTWSQSAAAFPIEASHRVPNDTAVVFKISPATPW